MSVNPSQRVKRRAARAEVQLAKQVRSKFLAPGEHGTVADNIKGMVYRKFAAPEHEAGEDEELKRQSKLNQLISFYIQGPKNKKTYNTMRRSEKITDKRIRQLNHALSTWARPKLTNIAEKFSEYLDESKAHTKNLRRRSKKSKK